MKCRFCKRELKGVTAVKLGYGPVCAKKHALQLKLKEVEETENIVDDPDSNKYMVI
jgi:hypothetical protein